MTTVFYLLMLCQVPRVLTEALDNAGMEVGDVDWLLLHQVNERQDRSWLALARARIDRYRESKTKWPRHGSWGHS